MFIDDRYDMFPVEVAEDYNKLLSSKPGWRGVLDKYRINIIVWPRHRGIVQVLEQLPGWTVLREDKVATVLVRDRPLR